MLRVIAFIILWSLPWSPEYRPAVATLEIKAECRETFTEAAYEASTRTLLVCPDEVRSLRDLRRVVVHGSLYHMQSLTRIGRRTGGWADFERAVLAELLMGTYSEHERASVLAAVDAPTAQPWANRLHGELPTITGFDVPPSLCRWYPWLRACGP